jgi:hypothetical protein
MLEGGHGGDGDRAERRVWFAKNERKLGSRRKGFGWRLGQFDWAVVQVVKMRRRGDLSKVDGRDCLQPCGY